LITSLPLPKTWPHPSLIGGAYVFLARPDSTGSTSQLETWTLSNSGLFTQIGTLALGSVASSIGAFGNLLGLQLNSSALLLDASNPAALTPIGKGQPQGCIGYDLSTADASQKAGLWIPLGDYGVSRVSVSP
jgi:hypothetical protein